MPSLKPRILLFFLIFLPTSLLADVVKPALVEISVFREGHFQVELRASIEALLTGINGQYKNTTEAPTAEEYDQLRELPPEELAIAFEPFKARLTEQIQLLFDGTPARLRIGEVDIPERGYTKVPRISVIMLEGEVPTGARSVTWYYPAAFGDNAVRVRQVHTAEEQYHWSGWQWIRDDAASEPFSLTEVATKRSVWQVTGDYVMAGFGHILPMGMDHILFILGLYLFSAKIRPLLWQVTMFTLAHTLTLALAMYGWVQLPANIVEPLIALSIAYVGIENIWHKRLVNSRLVLVFAFGLLHGLGFASLLTEFGMPKEDFAIALISFNIGVEFGQLAVIAGAWLLAGLWFGSKSWYRQAVVIPASLAIGVVGLYWFWDRLEWPLVV
jgi:hydrogenase/urease accessory protein HupE